MTDLSGINLGLQRISLRDPFSDTTSPALGRTSEIAGVFCSWGTPERSGDNDGWQRVIICLTSVDRGHACTPKRLCTAGATILNCGRRGIN